MAQKTSIRERTRRVTLVTRLANAKEVVVTGDFTDWSKERLKMSRAADGEWKATLSLPPGEYQYRLLVDGQWQDHLEASKRTPNGFGCENCVLVVS